MGMSLPKEIKLLSNLAEPNLSIITSISGSHLGNFKNIKDIAYAKSEIFEGMKKNGIAILPGDSIYLNILIVTKERGISINTLTHLKKIKLKYKPTVILNFIKKFFIRLKMKY